MTWVRIDDNIMSHPKMLHALALGGPEVVAIFLAGLTYCSRHLTDGHLQTFALDTLPRVRDPKKVIGALVTVGFWHEIEGGYVIHDFTEWNPSREEVERKRAESRTRKAKSRHAPVPHPSHAESRGPSQRDTPRDGLSDKPRDSGEDAARSSAGVTSLAGARSHPIPSHPIPETPPSPPVGGGEVSAEPTLVSEQPTPAVQEFKRQLALLPASEPTPPDDEPPAADVPESHRRYTDAYTDGLRAALGAPWAFPLVRAEWMALGAACRLALDPGGKGLRGEVLLAWIRTEAAAYARAKRSEGQFQRGFAPSKFVEWLNTGKPAAAPPRSGPVAVQPARPGGSNWSSKALNARPAGGIKP